MNDGLGRLAELIIRYQFVEQIYLHSVILNLTTELKTAIRKLYKAILEFEALALCHFNRSAVRQITRNTFTLDDWRGLLENIQNLDSACKELMQLLDAKGRQESTEKLRDQLNALLKLFQEKFEVQLDSGLLAELVSSHKEHQQWQYSQAESKCHQTFRTSDYQAHKDRNPVRVAGTCQWFLKHDNYHGWREKQSASLLWVSADPGCGKSVLSKFLVDEELSGLDCVVCYFFFKDDNEKQKTATNALCALLHQLFQYKPALIKHAKTPVDQNGQEIIKLFYVLWSLLVTATQDPNAGQVVCVLDALDECEEESRFRLIDAFNRFYHSKNKSSMKGSLMKILVTSRPYHNIEFRFCELMEDLPTIRLAGEEESEQISHEIDCVIEDRVEKIGQSFKLRDEIKLHLRERLLNVSQRTYLWLKLVLEEIESALAVVASSRKQIDRVIDTIPKTLDLAYEAILQKSSNILQTRRLLHLVIAALQPLELKELNIALELEENSRNYDDLDLEPNDRFTKRIRNLCGLFVTVIDCRVYLIHHTAKEFLINKEACSPSSNVTFPMSGNWKHSFHTVESNYILAKACMLYLLFPLQNFDILSWMNWELSMEKLLLRRGLKVYEEHAFLSYAATYWSVHCRKAESAMKTIINLILKVSEPDSNPYRLWTLIDKNPGRGGWNHRFNNLMVVSALGLFAAVEFLLHQGVDVNAQAENELTALHLAAANDCGNVVSLLLTHQANVNFQDYFGYTALHLAAENDHSGILNLLLTHQANVNLQTKTGSSALHLATKMNHSDVVNLLVTNQADVNLQTKSGNSALHLATKWNHDNIVILLLTHQANINLQTNNGTTALHLAAENGHGDIVNLLLTHQANVNLPAKNRTTALRLAAANGLMKTIMNTDIVNIQDDEGMTALHLAARSGHGEVVKTFLNTDIVKIRDNEGQTALHLAAWKGHSEVVKILLNADIVNIQDNEGQTALHLAARSGHGEVVKILLNADIVNIQDNEGQTALHLAAWIGHSEVVKILLNADTVNIQNNEGVTALHYAALLEHSEVMRSLLGCARLEINTRDSNGETALYYAWDTDRDQIVQLLIEAGAAESEDWYGLKSLFMIE